VSTRGSLTCRYSGWKTPEDPVENAAANREGPRFGSPRLPPPEVVTYWSERVDERWVGTLEFLDSEDQSLWKVTERLMRVPTLSPPCKCRGTRCPRLREGGSLDRQPWSWSSVTAVGRHVGPGSYWGGWWGDARIWVCAHKWTDITTPTAVAQAQVCKNHGPKRHSGCGPKTSNKAHDDFSALQAAHPFCDGWHVSDLKFAARSHVQKLQTCQSACLRTATNTLWYVGNGQIHEDVEIPFADRTRAPTESLESKVIGRNPLVRQIGRRLCRPEAGWCRLW
jgi:hypothetical protein